MEKLARLQKNLKLAKVVLAIIAASIVYDKFVLKYNPTAQTLLFILMLLSYFFQKKQLERIEKMPNPEVIVIPANKQKINFLLASGLSIFAMPFVTYAFLFATPDFPSYLRTSLPIINTVLISLVWLYSYKKIIKK